MESFPNINIIFKQLNKSSTTQYTKIYAYFWSYFSGRHSTVDQNITYKWRCYLVKVNDNINTYEFRFLNVIPDITIFITINFDTTTKTHEISKFLIKKLTN